MMTREIGNDGVDPATNSAGPPAETDPAAAGGARGRLLTSLLLGLLSFVVYNANLRSISAGDTYPARYLPFSIVGHRTIALDPVASVAEQGRGGGAYWMMRRPEGYTISFYPIVLPTVIAPLYVPAVVHLRATGWDGARLDQVARVMEKLSASLIAALSVALLYLVLRRRVDGRTALMLTVAYAFGTTTWVISSQALWQHGLGQLLLVGALLVLTRPCVTWSAAVAGLLLGLVATNRPPDAVIAAALGCYALAWAGRRRWGALVAGAALPMMLVVVYNLLTTGNAAGGYGLVGRPWFFKHDLLTGLAGLLVSPTRGLLVFSPFLLFLVLAWRYRSADRDVRRLELAMWAAVALQLVLYAKADWRGGLSWGPRYLTDIIPLLVVLLAPVVAALRGALRAAFAAAVCISIAIEAIGAFAYTGSLDLPIYSADRGEHHDMRGSFLWRNSAIVTSLANGLQPPELVTAIRGNFDGFETSRGLVTEIAAGEEVSAIGWGLAGKGTPWQVAVNIDGRLAGATSSFFERPDVRAATGTKSHAGWRVPIDTKGLAPGEHKLTALAWAFTDGEPRFLAERTLLVRGQPAGAPAATSGDDLAEAARVAASRIREHQQPDGYWLTAHTTVTRYVDPRPEMNTYLTALLVDLVAPVASAAGLDDSAARAKEHLTRQVEPGGLVRYHGLPDGPGIGTLGCAITPDTDDTALVWRIAPPRERERLTEAFGTIERYRRPDGLYRTWLAPRDAYQCLDPGRDPNPADLVIQMHLLQLLAGTEPAKARALCEALRPRVDDDGVWVYYRKAPLVASLRLADLRRAGCALELPEARMRTEVPGQQVWISLARLLDDAERGGTRTPDAAVIRALLREIARDDFALVRTSPPLLYHNDLTATVPRYYWSEDAGYALWLRLLDAHDRSGR